MFDSDCCVKEHSSWGWREETWIEAKRPIKRLFHQSRQEIVNLDLGVSSGNSEEWSDSTFLSEVEPT